MDKIVLLGCGGHAKSVVDSMEQLKEYEIVGFLDTQENLGEVYKNYRVIGTDHDLKEIYQQGVRHAFITLGYMGKSSIRNELYQRIREIGFSIPIIVDSTAIIAQDTKIGEGTFVGKGAIINAGTTIGSLCIINTGAIVEHDCTIQDFTHVSVGATICGGVSVGTDSFIGANAILIQNVVIGNNVLVGAGSVVTKNIENQTKYYEKREKVYE